VSVARHRKSAVVPTPVGLDQSALLWRNGRASDNISFVDGTASRGRRRMDWLGRMFGQPSDEVIGPLGFVSPNARRRREWRRQEFFRLARSFTPFVLATDGIHRFYVPTADLAVGRDTFVSGSFDRAATRRAMAELSVDVTGMHTVDIGANIGTTTVDLVCHYGVGRVVAIEPEPTNFRLLRLNVIENAIEDSVTTVNLAVSDGGASVGMRLARDNWGDHCVVRDEADLRVPATTLDRLVSRGTIDIERTALVWMDVQGHETQVLDGSRALLRKGIPFIAEFWPYGLGDYLKRLEILIAEHFRIVIDLWPSVRASASTRWRCGRHRGGRPALSR
jgi:FkbM family methyltransferase